MHQLGAERWRSAPATSRYHRRSMSEYRTSVRRTARAGIVTSVGAPVNASKIFRNATCSAASLRPLGHKPLLPTTGCRLTGTCAAHDLRRAAGVRRQQHDVCWPHMLLRSVLICQDRRELLAISGAYFDDDARAHVAESHLPASHGILIWTHHPVRFDPLSIQTANPTLIGSSPHARGTPISRHPDI